MKACVGNRFGLKPATFGVLLVVLGFLIPVEMLQAAQDENERVYQFLEGIAEGRILFALFGLQFSLGVIFCWLLAGLCFSFEDHALNLARWVGKMLLIIVPWTGFMGLASYLVRNHQSLVGYLFMAAICIAAISLVFQATLRVYYGSLRQTALFLILAVLAAGPVAYMASAFLIRTVVDDDIERHFANLFRPFYADAQAGLQERLGRTSSNDPMMTELNILRSRAKALEDDNRIMAPGDTEALARYQARRKSLKDDVIAFEQKWKEETDLLRE